MHHDWPYCPRCVELMEEVARLQGQYEREIQRLRGHLEETAAVFRSLPKVAADGAAKALDEFVQAHLSSSPGGAPHTTTRGSVMRMNAAWAQCHRTKLSDEARRRAIDRARALGALKPGFDESKLPWSWNRKGDEDGH